jgi:hypothetical protein
MKLNHVGDEAIQQYVLDEAGCDISVINHINTCSNCMAKAETYRLLFTEIQEQPKPVFDFDATQLVLSQLPQVKPAFEWSGLEQYLVLSIIATVVIATLFIFRQYLLTMLSGMSSYIVYTIIATMATVITYKVYEMYKKYQAQLNELNFN